MRNVIVNLKRARKSERGYKRGATGVTVLRVSKRGHPERVPFPPGAIAAQEASRPRLSVRPLARMHVLFAQICDN